MSTTSEPREHQWVVPPNADPGSYWEDRDCPVCGLRDSKIRNRQATEFGGMWRVTTPCIEPPPPSMSFDDLLADLKAHGLGQSEVYAVGNPKCWAIGFRRMRGRDEKLEPDIRIVPPQTLEHGWSELVRWLRARQYAPDTFAMYKSTTGNDGFTLAHGCDCGDDD